MNPLWNQNEPLSLNKLQLKLKRQTSLNGNHCSIIFLYYTWCTLSLHQNKYWSDLIKAIHKKGAWILLKYTYLTSSSHFFYVVFISNIFSHLRGGKSNTFKCVYHIANKSELAHLSCVHSYADDVTQQPSIIDLQKCHKNHLTNIFFITRVTPFTFHFS